MIKKALLLVVALFSVVAFGQNIDSDSKERIKDYIILEEIKGDLNNDGIDDYVYIFKDSFETVGRIYPNYEENGRGMIILLSDGNMHTLENFRYNCFESLDDIEHGAYHAPELFINIEDNKLMVGFYHGRNGNWSYTLGFQDSEFKLIGFDATYDNPNSDIMLANTVSVDLLSGTVVWKEERGELSNGDPMYSKITREIDKEPLMSIIDIYKFEELHSEIIAPYLK